MIAGSRGDAVARLFISAERLEAWTAEGRAALEGDKMTLVELGRVFEIRSAVRFTGVTGDATIDNSNSGVTLADVTGSAQEHASFGAVRVTNVAKATRITAENGSVSVGDLGGTVFVKTLPSLAR
jgi:hypothetical protein